MSEETKIELLKIAMTLSMPLIEKYPVNPNAPQTAHAACRVIFSEFLTTVNDSYQGFAEKLSGEK